VTTGDAWAVETHGGTWIAADDVVAIVQSDLAAAPNNPG
jgi:hypothetical protein